MDEERVERLAARRNARLRAKCPLAADRLPQERAERVVRALAGSARRMAECRARLAAQAKGHRDRVRALVTPGEFAALAARRAVLPASEEYAADFWRRQLWAVLQGRVGP
jgi:hypothetical protein